MSITPMVRIQLTGYGMTSRVGHIEITTIHQHRSIQLNLPASNYDTAVNLAKRHALELARSVGCSAESLQWDVHPKRPERGYTVLGMHPDPAEPAGDKEKRH